MQMVVEIEVLHPFETKTLTSTCVHPVEIHFFFKQMVSHCIIFFLTTYDPYLYKVEFIIDLTKRLVQSQPHTIVSKISTLELIL